MTSPLQISNRLLSSPQIPHYTQTHEEPEGKKGMTGPWNETTEGDNSRVEESQLRHHPYSN